MRRGVGVKSYQIKSATDKAYAEKGKELTEDKLKHIKEQIEVFKSKLEEFARKYSKKINNDPEFRAKFQLMCTKVGVDPISSKKTFWGQLLGNVNDYYYSLAVEILHLSMNLRNQTGGIISLHDLVTKLNEKRRQQSKKTQGHSHSTDVSIADVERAIDSLKILGNGLTIIEENNVKMLVSVPMDVSLAADTSTILGLAASRVDHNGNSCLARGDIIAHTNWKSDRVERLLSNLLKKGIIWIDYSHENKTKDPAETKYNEYFYFPAFCTYLTNVT